MVEEFQPLSEPEPIRRSTRERKPNYYRRDETNLTLAQEPTFYSKAISCTDQEKWRNAMNTEMKSLKDNDVWDLAGRKKVGGKCIFKMKTGADGKIERYKARLVAQGFTQKFGSDYDKTFCPVARQRALLALSVQYGLKIHQIDVATAFLNGNLEEEWRCIWLNRKVSYGREHLVCKLKKSIYGLKQSPRCWNTALDTYLKKIGFTQSNSDPCIYYKGIGGELVYMGVYVIFAAKTDEQLKNSLAATENS